MVGGVQGVPVSILSLRYVSVPDAIGSIQCVYLVHGTYVVFLHFSATI